ncbi:VgrG-related protein [Chloroflexota bacterium]
MAQAQELISQMYLKVNRKNVSEEIMDNIISVEVDDGLLLPDMFSIHLRDSDFKWIDATTFDLGKTLEISAKAQGESKATELINAEITAIEPEFIKDIGATALITGYVKFHRLQRGRKTRTFLNKKDSDIVQQIARECSLSATVDSTPGVHEHVYQAERTDAEFIMDIAERVGYYVYFEAGKLNFRKEPKARGQKPVLEWGENLLEFQARLTTAEQVNTVEVPGYDIKTGKAYVGKATSPKGTPKVGGESDGGKLAQKSHHMKSVEIVNHHPVRTQKEADERAQAALNEIGSTFFQAEGTCIGDPAVHAGVEVKVKGTGKRFSGTYLVTRAIHRYDASGYTTRFEITGHRANTLRQLLTSKNGNGYGVLLGIVTNNDDKDGMARVKVKFPTISDKEESTWARVVTPMAGPSRGIEFIPEVNDEVLVAFEYNDINHPYILGSLWNGKDKPPQPNGQAVKDGKVLKRIIQSRVGHKIILDDTDGEEKISIIDKTDKNFVEIDTKQNLVTIKTEKNSIAIGTDKNTLTIVADGAISIETKEDVTIKGKNITLEATANAKMAAKSNVDIEATSKSTVKGNAGVDVGTSAAPTNVKGAVINLN